MHPFVLACFQVEVAYQCRAALTAYSALKQAAADCQLAGSDLPTTLAARDRIWFAVDALLNAAANISKLLWSKGGASAKRRKPLRDSLNVSDSSVLRDRELRNHFEHFDHRLETYLQAGPTPLGIRNVGSLQALQLSHTDMFQHYDPVSGEIAFGDHVVLARHIAMKLWPS